MSVGFTQDSHCAIFNLPRIFLAFAGVDLTALRAAVLRIPVRVGPVALSAVIHGALADSLFGVVGTVIIIVDFVAVF